MTTPRNLRGYSAITMVITAIVVLAATLVVVRATWGLSGAAGGSPRVSTPDGVTATLPEGAPADVAVDVVLSTHASAILSEARAAAAIANTDPSELDPADYLGRYPVIDGDRTIDATAVPGAQPKVELTVTGAGDTTSMCVNLGTGTSQPGQC
jgi:hypothetical protein